MSGILAIFLFRKATDILSNASEYDFSIADFLIKKTPYIFQQITFILVF